jgi:hypothetical protein
VTNSSSSSFVIYKKDIDEKYVKYIEDVFCHIDSDELLEKCIDCDVYDAVYYLVDYKPSDLFMHIWVRRDEAMDDDTIDDILYDYDRRDVSPKFSYHY